MGRFLTTTDLITTVTAVQKSHKLNRLCYSWLFIAGLLVSVNAYAQSAVSSASSSLSIEEFARPGENLDVIISPSGSYLAVEKRGINGKGEIVILNAADLSEITRIAAGSGNRPNDPVWVTDDYLIVGFTRGRRLLPHQANIGELDSIRISTGVRKPIVKRQGYKISRWTSRNLNDLHGYAEIAHTLPEDDEHILIRYTPWHRSNRDGEKVELVKVNVINGKTKLIAKAPSAYADFVFSASGELRFSVGLLIDEKKKSNQRIVHRYVTNKVTDNNKNGKWELLGDLPIEAESVGVFSAQDDDKAYLWAEFLDSTDKIYLYDFNTGEKQQVFHHPTVDPTSIFSDPQKNQLIYVRYDPDYPDLEIIDKQHPIGRHLSQLQKTFKKTRLRVRSSTADGSKIVVHVESDTTPGHFYLFDAVTNELKKLMAVKSWFEDKPMTTMQPIQLAASDGKKLHGYLTLPLEKNNAEASAPLVVIPHGGPHGVRDFWKNRSTVQLLASRGYAVLQINYRGSAGYGAGFAQAGYQQWGDAIQRDIIDATRWAQQQSGVSAKKTCILGSSFGGYSALMSTIKAPELFQCAISISGIYDLNLMWSTADINDTNYGKNYLKDAIGTNKDQLKNFSPLYHIDQLQAPVMLFHGEKDWRVDIKHFDRMVESLQRRQHDFQAYRYHDEGHGIVKTHNRIDYFEKVLAFLELHIGSPENTVH